MSGINTLYTPIIKGVYSLNNTQIIIFLILINGGCLDLNTKLLNLENLTTSIILFILLLTSFLLESFLVTITIISLLLVKHTYLTNNFFSIFFLLEILTIISYVYLINKRGNSLKDVSIFSFIVINTLPCVIGVFLVKYTYFLTGSYNIYNSANLNYTNTDNILSMCSIFFLIKLGIWPNVILKNSLYKNLSFNELVFFSLNYWLYIQTIALYNIKFMLTYTKESGTFYISLIFIILTTVIYTFSVKNIKEFLVISSFLSVNYMMFILI